MVLHNVFLIFFKKPLEIIFCNPSGLKAKKTPIVSSQLGEMVGWGKSFSNFDFLFNTKMVNQNLPLYVKERSQWCSLTASTIIYPQTGFLCSHLPFLCFLHMLSPTNFKITKIWYCDQESVYILVMNVNLMVLGQHPYVLYLKSTSEPFTFMWNTCFCQNHLLSKILRLVVDE